MSRIFFRTFTVVLYHTFCSNLYFFSLVGSRRDIWCNKRGQASIDNLALLAVWWTGTLFLRPYFHVVTVTRLFNLINQSEHICSTPDLQHPIQKWHKTPQWPRNTSLTLPHCITFVCFRNKYVCWHQTFVQNPELVSVKLWGKSSLTSSQFCSSFTQKRARWKLLLSVRSERQKATNKKTAPSGLQQRNETNILNTHTDGEMMKYKRPVPKLKHKRKYGFTVADNGCPRPSVVDPAHSFVSLRSGRVL